jgi:hypothetical protein
MLQLKSFGELSEHIWKKIENLSISCSRIDIVFDNYHTENVQETTCVLVEKHICLVVYFANALKKVVEINTTQINGSFHKDFGIESSQINVFCIFRSFKNELTK